MVTLEESPLLVDGGHAHQNKTTQCTVVGESVTNEREPMCVLAYNYKCLREETALGLSELFGLRGGGRRWVKHRKEGSEVELAVLDCVLNEGHFAREVIKVDNRTQ